MFAKLTVEELLEEERRKNLILINRQIDLENALLELADIVGNKGDEIDG